MGGIPTKSLLINIVDLNCLNSSITKKTINIFDFQFPIAII